MRVTTWSDRFIDRLALSSNGAARSAGQMGQYIEARLDAGERHAGISNLVGMLLILAVVATAGVAASGKADTWITTLTEKVGDPPG